jgi:hypothetical protein
VLNSNSTSIIVIGARCSGLILLGMKPSLHSHQLLFLVAAFAILSGASSSAHDAFDLLITLLERYQDAVAPWFLGKMHMMPATPGPANTFSSAIPGLDGMSCWICHPIVAALIGSIRLGIPLETLIPSVARFLCTARYTNPDVCSGLFSIHFVSYSTGPCYSVQ